MHVQSRLVVSSLHGEALEVQALGAAELSPFGCSSVAGRASPSDILWCVCVCVFAERLLSTAFATKATCCSGLLWLRKNTMCCYALYCVLYYKAVALPCIERFRRGKAWACQVA